MSRKVFITTLIIGIVTALVGCGTQAAPAPTPTSPPLAAELIFYDWAEDMPPSVLDAFTDEYGVKVTYVTYETQEEAFTNIKGGAVYDVVVVDNDYVRQWVEAGLLAELDFRNVPNIKNIAANFRDLAYDPENKHAIPFNWGTTGLVVRSDLVAEPITSWSDLWDPRYAGKVAVRTDPRELVAIVLKSLGYSGNSEDPEALRAAEERLLALSDAAVFVDNYGEAAVPKLLTGDAVMLIGWAEDVLLGREDNEAITFVLPKEGALLWGDNFVIPASSPRKYTAEVFLNFLLRPEISAQIVNENYYASANEAAGRFIDPEILDNEVIFPANHDLINAEVYLPLSPKGEQVYREIFERFAAQVDEGEVSRGE